MARKCFFSWVRAGDAITMEWKNDTETFIWRFVASDYLGAVALVFAQAMDPELSLTQVESEVIQEKMRIMADPKPHRRMIAQAWAKLARFTRVWFSIWR